MLSGRQCRVLSVASRGTLRVASRNSLSVAGSSSAGGTGGTITKLFLDKGYAIIEDGLKREYLFRLEDARASSSSVTDSASLPSQRSEGTRWSVGMPVLFSPRERANMPYERRFVAEDVRMDAAFEQSRIVANVIARMEDRRWRLVLADGDAGDQSGYEREATDTHVPSSANTVFPPGYDLRYLVCESDLRSPVMGAKRRALVAASEASSTASKSGLDDNSPDDDEESLSPRTMERARREAEETDILNLSVFR